MATLKLPAIALIAHVSDEADVPSGTPSIQMFYAAPNPIKPSARTTIFWEMPVAPKVRILAAGYDSGIIANTGQGYLTLDPGPAVTTTYTLQALDAADAILVVNGNQLVSSLTVAIS